MNRITVRERASEDPLPGDWFNLLLERVSPHVVAAGAGIACACWPDAVTVSQPLIEGLLSVAAISVGFLVTAQSILITMSHNVHMLSTKHSDIDLFRRFEPVALAIASRIRRRSPASVELADLQQTARMALLEAARSWRPQSDVDFLRYSAALILRAVRKAAAVRRTAPVPDLPSPGPTIEMALAENGLLLRLAVEVGFLNARDREMVFLRFDLGLPLREVAARTGVSITRVQQRLNRATATLRARLTDPL